MSYIPEHFSIEELVSENAYKVRGDKAIELLDDRALMTLDRLRDKYGSITVNNWSFGGNREWSGLRTPDSPYYSAYSQHTYGRAFDCLFKEVSAEDVRRDIIDNQDSFEFEFITAIELDTSWLHFDVRNCNKLKTFKP